MKLQVNQKIYRRHQGIGWKTFSVTGGISADAFDQLVKDEKSKDASATVQLEFYVKDPKIGGTIRNRSKVKNVGHPEPFGFFFTTIAGEHVPKNIDQQFSIKDETKVKNFVTGNTPIIFSACSGTLVPDKEGHLVMKLTVGSTSDLTAFTFRIGNASKLDKW